MCAYLFPPSRGGTMHEYNESLSVDTLLNEVTFGQVLTYYDIELRGSGDKRFGFCPLPKHRRERQSRCFFVDVATGTWKCVGCHERGNIADFVIAMEQSPYSSGKLVQVLLAILR